MITKLLALDTSTTCTGYAVYLQGAYVSSGLIKEKDKDANTRLDHMIADIYRTIKEVEPDIIVLENEVIGGSRVTVMLSKLVGAIRGWAVGHGISYYELDPAQWRSLIGVQAPGIKREEYKAIVQKYVIENIVDKKFEKDDESDAVAIGQAYINMFHNG